MLWLIFWAARHSFNVFKDEITNLGNVELHFNERGRGRPEKEVDVKIATDILVHTFNEILSSKRGEPYSIAVLVSGDSDFAPAVEAIKNFRRKVYVCFFNYAISGKLRECSDGILELSVEDIVIPDFASIVTNSFKNEFSASINRKTLKGATGLIYTLILKDYMNI